MWTKYFKLVRLRRGRVITPSHGEIDFSRDDIPVETCRQLFESDFPYLEITDEGKKKFYGIVPDLVVSESDPVFEPLPNADDNPDELKVSVPIRPDIPVSEAEPAATFIDLPETVETEVSPPNRKKYVKRKSPE